MSISKIYVYFNESGELVSKAPYVKTSVVRQGSDFELNILFNDDTNLIKPGDMISVEFKCPGENKPNLFPFISFYDKYVQEGEQSLKPENLNFYESGFIEPNTIFKEDLSKYGIKADKRYRCWTFNSVNAYKKALPVLTEKDGNLEVQITIFEQGKAITPTTILGTFKIFIEKTLNYESPFNVSQEDLDRFLKEVKEGISFNAFGIHAFYIDEKTGELMVKFERSDDLEEGNYSINQKGELIITI